VVFAVVLIALLSGRDRAHGRNRDGRDHYVATGRDV